MPSMVSQKQLPKNWYPSSRSLVGVCLHFDCMRCIWRIFALFGTKVNPPFPLLLQDKPCWKMSLTALVLWTKVQSCFKGWLGISQVDRATFHFGLNYLLSKRNTSIPMPDPVQWKGPSSVSEASAAVVAQEAREGFISEWWMRLLKIVNEVLVILHKSCSFTFLPWLHFIFFMTCYWGLGDLAQNALSY